jgi:beta propeller repeat protein
MTAYTFWRIAILSALFSAILGSASHTGHASASHVSAPQIAPRVFPIATNQGGDTSPAISGAFVVWWRLSANKGCTRGDIYGKNIAIGRTFRVTSGGYIVGPPVIDGTTVVWEDCRTCTVTRDAMGYVTFRNMALYAENLATGQLFPITTDPRDQESPVISGTTVVWQDLHTGNGSIYGAALA